jgi:hypothetical protein
MKVVILYTVNLLFVKQLFWKRLEQSTTNLVQTDIIKMQNNVKYHLYQQIRTQCKQDSIRNTNTHWKYIFLYGRIQSLSAAVTLDNCNLVSVNAPETLRVPYLNTLPTGLPD